MEKSLTINDKQIIFKDKLTDKANMIRDKSRQAYNKIIIDSRAWEWDAFSLDDNSYLYLLKRPLNAPTITTTAQVFRPVACTNHITYDIDWPKILRALVKHYDVFQPGLMFPPLYKLDNPGWVIWKPV